MSKASKVIFVGIAGPSGSGKTTLCKKLKLVLEDCEHIRLDNYFKSPKTFPMKHGFHNWEMLSNLKFDLLAKHLKVLKNGICVNTKTFPKQPGAQSQPLTLKPARVVLVEGFFLYLNKKVRDLLDVKIYLDIPLELMLPRRAVRFGARHISEYDIRVAIPEFRRRGIAQKKYADYVINAALSRAKVIKTVMAIIKKRDHEV